MSSDLPPDALVLWYAQPAVDWTAALPVGNGRLGAMVFGRTGTERIQLNEQTIWTGRMIRQDPVVLRRCRKSGGWFLLGNISRRKHCSPKP